VAVLRVAFLLLLAVVPPAGAAAQDAPQGDEQVATAPVELDGAVLFRVRGSTSLPAVDRAGLIRQRIAAAAADPSVSPLTVAMIERDGSTRIVSGERLLMAVLDADAALEGLSRAELAALHMNRIRQAIADYRGARSPAARSRSYTRTGVGTAIFFLSLAVLFGLWRWFNALLRRRVQARIHSVGIQSFEVMRADRIRAALERTFFALRVLTYLGVLVTFATFALAQWPETRDLSRRVVSVLLDPLLTLGRGLITNTPRLVFLAVLFFVIRGTLRLIRLFFDAVERGTVTLNNFDPEWSQPTYKIVRIAVVAFGLIVAYPYIPGSQSDAFKGVSLFIGIVFSLGSSTAIANIIAGYMMTYRRAFKVGDRVKIGDAIGEVIHARLQVTHLRSMKNEEIVIPNSQILGGEVLNYTSLSKDRGLILHSEVAIGYDTPWRQVEALLLTAAARTPGLGTQPPPFVLVHKLGEFAITYEVNVPCGDVMKMGPTYTALHHSILDVFNEHGVQIMVPAYEGDPPEPKVVPPDRWFPASPVTPADPAGIL